MLGLSLKTKDVFSYAMFPRVVPRAKVLIFTGFGYMAFLMAHLYAMVRLLPNHHPYLQAKNIGRYNVQNVVLEAARRLKFSRRHIDQLFVFFALLAAIVIVLLQIVFLAYALFIVPFISPAIAFSWFDTPNPTNDLAFTILNDIFGVPDLFCSSFTLVCPANNPIVVSPFHNALHELFRFYSTALLLIGILIFLYFIFVVILETVVSGVPFGQRMQHVWVPVRLVGAVGLLIPINYGLSSGQYIALYAAKYGSNFATTGWVDFNDAIGDHGMFAGAGPLAGNPIGERYSLVAIPQTVDFTSVLEAMSLVHTCAYAYMTITGQPPAGGPGLPYRITDDYTAPATNFMIRPYLVKHESPWTTAAATFPVPTNPAIRQLITGVGAPNYTQAVGFYYGGDIVIRFGEYRVDTAGNPVYKDDEGYVAPLCGDMRVPIVDLAGVGTAAANGGSDYMLRFYYEEVLRMWFNDNELKQFARTFVATASKHRVEATNMCSNAALSGCGTVGFQACGAPCEQNPPFTQFISRKMGANPPAAGTYQFRANDAIRQAWGLYVQSGTNHLMEANILDRGWAGAGMWYNKLAEINGSFTDGVRAIPKITRYPLVMEQVKSERARQDQSSFSRDDMFETSIKAPSGNDAAKLKIDRGEAELDGVAVPLNNVWKWWGEDTSALDNEEETYQSNVFVHVINMLLGTSGLANIRGANQHIHPLAQLILVGKGLVDSAVTNILAGTASAFLGGALGASKNQQIKTLGGMLEVFSSLMEVTAFVGLTAGFILFYVLPFLPFVYFFFAVGSWMKAIFEAMVAVPLWALAHLRIDGDGLPGEAAANGYYLILEIFIRPILTVVGLIAALSIFATQVRVLNLIWDLVTTNVSGYSDGDILATLIAEDVRFKGTPLDQFFYTIIYTIVCYMLAVASFKLIDKIPDNILRWAGSGVSSFGDLDQDHVESLNRYAATGGMTVGSQAVGATRGLASGTGNALAKMVQDEKGAASS